MSLLRFATLVTVTSPSVNEMLSGLVVRAPDLAFVKVVPIAVLLACAASLAAVFGCFNELRCLPAVKRRTGSTIITGVVGSVWAPNVRFEPQRIAGSLSLTPLPLERPRPRQRLQITTYYCDIKSPWQKGGNENFNGRLRRYLPRDFDIYQLTQQQLKRIVRMMNKAPRKCLPEEAYSDACRASR